MSELLPHGTVCDGASLVVDGNAADSWLFEQSVLRDGDHTISVALGPAIVSLLRPGV